MKYTDPNKLSTELFQHLSVIYDFLEDIVSEVHAIML